MKHATFLKIPIIILTLINSGCKNESSDAEDSPKNQQSTVTNYETDPNIDTGTKAFLKVLNSGGTPLEKLAPADARNVLLHAQTSVNVDLSGIEESEKTISQNGLNIKLNIVRPAGINEKLPAFIFVHGGGWVLGDYPTHKRMVRDLVVASGFVAIFVNYSLSPEVKYPVALNEIYAAAVWVAEHGDKINIDGKNLAIAGNSAGGNLAASVAMMAKENDGPKLKMQLLFWPVAAAGFDTESYAKFGTDRFLTASVMKWMFDQYTTDAEQRKGHHISLVNATREQLTDLPPTLIQTAENDILRDEGETFGRKLDEAGVKVTTIRYNGMIHDFGLLNGLAQLPTTRSLFDHAGAELKKYLKK